MLYPYRYPKLTMNDFDQIMHRIVTCPKPLRPTACNNTAAASDYAGLPFYVPAHHRDLRIWFMSGWASRSVQRDDVAI